MFYPDWSQPSNIIIALAIVFFSSLLTFREIKPNTRLSYSKFTSNDKSNTTISSFLGMLTIYVPSFSISVLLLFLYPRSTIHLKTIAYMLFFHYAKRVYEVIYVHKYSGKTKLQDCLQISSGYVGYLISVTYFSSQVPNVSSFHTFFGCILFLCGEYTNYYHHLILSNLRQHDSKKYVIPNSGLFQYVWCPHYTAEIVTFIAMVIMTQHFMILLLQFGSATYLAARAYNTREWYKTKFTTIPERACLIPFLF